MNTVQKSTSFGIKTVFGIIAMAAFASSFFSCATIKADKGKVQSMQKIALVGYSAEQEMPKSFEIKFTGNQMFSEASHVTQMTEQLRASLKQDLGLNIVEISEVQNNPKYKALVEKYTKGFQWSYPVAEGTTVFRPEGMLYSHVITNRLNQAERQQLMNDLGVDGILVVTNSVASILHGFAGIGSIHPKSTLRVLLYSKEDAGKVVWFDNLAVGESGQEGAMAVAGITKTSAFNQSVVEASKNANQMLVSRYKSEAK